MASPVATVYPVFGTRFTVPFSWQQCVAVFIELGKVSLTCVIDSLFPQHYSVTNDPLEHLPGDFVIGKNTQRRISDSERQQERKKCCYDRLTFPIFEFFHQQGQLCY